MRLYGWNDIQPVKQTCSMLYLEIKTSICATFMLSMMNQPVGVYNLSDTCATM